MWDYPDHAVAFLRDLLLQPVWVQLWCLWMAAVVAAAPLPMLMRRETRPDGLAAAGAAVALAVLMPFWHAETGYTRILGLPHFPVWGALLVWLYARRRRLASPPSVRRSAAVLAATIAASLVLDGADAVRYLLGERAALGG